MINRLKKQNILVVILEFIIIIAIFIGVTYALYNIGNNILLNTSNIGIDTSIYGNTYLDSDNIKLEPINDKDISSNNNNVLKIKFKVRGDKNNLVSNIIYDIALVDLEIDCDLISKYLKWELIKNNQVLTSGSFDSNFDTITNGRLVLTNTQQDLLDYSSNGDSYEFRLWLSDSCQNDDINTCLNSEDQSYLLNKSIDGKIEVELNTGSKTSLERNPSLEKNNCINNLDTSGANRPTIDDGMIPVYYDTITNSFNKADKSNSINEYKWYDYNNNMWANIVLVKDYSKYTDKSLGTIINNDDITAFYVWIPRYKYQVWNIDGNSNHYDALNAGINIIFENGKSDTGEITCTSDNCVGNNGEWLSHKAFNNTKGFWISKYNISGTDKNPLSIDTNKYLINYNTTKALETSRNIRNYGINNHNIKLLDNQIWGSISYLTYSKYGICKNNTCNKNIDSTTDNMYGIYYLNSDINEIVLYKDSILGSNTFEVNNIITNKDILYMNGLFTSTTSSSSYGFRNVLYK